MESKTKENREISKVGSAEIAEGKFYAAVGYVSILCFIPLFLKRDNKFAQFHGRQGLILFILEFVVAVLIAIPVAGEVIFKSAWLVFGICSLAGMIKVFLNEFWEMPVIYPLSSKITL